MKSCYKFLLASLTLFLLTTLINAQTFDGEWICDYATIDDRPNGTGLNTLSVAVNTENNFVALVSRVSTASNYLVGYMDGDSTNGRLGQFGYGTGEMGEFQQFWVNFFEQVALTDAKDLVFSNNQLYVANNDDNHNILVFEMTQDSVVSAPLRLQTGEDDIWAIDADGNGNIYVTVAADSFSTGKVLVYAGPENESGWSGSRTAAPLQEIAIPDVGQVRGVAVNDAGTVVYASNFLSKKVYCYIGSPEGGYTLYDGFELMVDDVIENNPQTGDPLSAPVIAGPWDMKFMNTKNILYVAADANFETGDAYAYARIYLVNPNTGAVMDTINVAEWNYAQTGQYNNRPGGGNQGNVSGYASTYKVDADQDFNIYSQSYYGWTAEKWSYEGTLPEIDLLITGIEKVENVLPDEFSLSQNYPNPFNPSTTIEFSITKQSDVTLNVYTVTGELVETLFNNSSLGAGTYKITFDASRLASGTYIYTLSNGSNQISNKMILLK